MPSCRICNKPLIWKQPYKKGDRPVENVDLKCIICDGSVGCPTCEFIEDCKPQDVSPMCICKNCEETCDSFDSYKKSVIKKFPLLNLKI